MKEIPLTQGKVALVDDEDYDFLTSGTKWRAHHRKYGHKEKWYVMRYVQGSGHIGKSEYMHRIVMNAPSGMSVDHINDNPLDNRKENLRVVDHKTNMQNMKRANKPASGYTGVYRTNKKWEAKITYTNTEGERITVRKSGYATPESAAKAYNEIANEVYGQFANLNTLP